MGISAWVINNIIDNCNRNTCDECFFNDGGICLFIDAPEYWNKNKIKKALKKLTNDIQQKVIVNNFFTGDKYARVQSNKL